MKKILTILSLMALASCKKETVTTQQQPIPEAVPRVAVLPVNKPEPVKTPKSVKPLKKAAITPVIVSKPTNNIKDSLYLTQLLHSFEDAPQIFTVTSAKTSTVKGKGGTVITVNPNNLTTVNGSAIGNTITVELKELSDTQSLLKNNAQTMSGNKLLVSGGSYYIGMKSDGNELQLKPGKTLEVQFPKATDENMELFYGDNSKGQMDWQKSSVSFNDTLTAEFGDVLPINTNQDTALANIADNMKFREKEWEIQRKLYAAIQLNKLGWINCDRFNYQTLTNVKYTVNPTDSVRYAQVFLVFKGINSLVTNYYTGGKATLYNMPVNRKATFIMVAIKEEKVYAYSSDIVITNGMTVVPELKEISENEMAQLFEKR